MGTKRKIGICGEVKIPWCLMLEKRGLITVFGV